MPNLVQYVIVSGEIIRKLNWPLGAVIAQCCHATTAVTHIYKDDPDTIAYFNDIDRMHKVVLEVFYSLKRFPFPLHPPFNAFNNFNFRQKLKMIYEKLAPNWQQMRSGTNCGSKCQRILPPVSR